MNRTRNLLTSLALLLLAACSDSATDANLPQTAQPEVPETEPTQVQGIAAIGVALDGARIEVIDAAGDPVAVGDVLTGNDGAYSVNLPPATALPVIVRVIPVTGEPLLNIIAGPIAEGESVIANINPVTNLVAQSVLDNVDATDNDALAGALANTDVAAIEDAGEDLIQGIFGADVTYAAFASDANFVASDGESPGSGADAVLDTIARLAEAGGRTPAEELQMLAEQDIPPALMEDVDFQVALVGEMARQGRDAASLGDALMAIGALEEPAAGESSVFQTIVAEVPMLLAASMTAAEAVTDNPESIDVVLNATIDLVRQSVSRSQDDFGGDDASVIATLTSDDFAGTAVAVIQTTVLPVLALSAQAEDPEAVIAAGGDLINTLVTEAAAVVGSFSWRADEAEAVGSLITAFVTANLGADKLTAEQLAALAAGEVTASDLVPESGEAADVLERVSDFVAENPEAFAGDLQRVIRELPTGNWDEYNWDGFKWG